MVRTAQHDHDTRANRAANCRACSHERASPNTVGPLPDMSDTQRAGGQEGGLHLHDVVLDGAQRGLQPVVQVIGDAAVRDVLSARQQRPRVLPPVYMRGVTRP